MIFLRLSLSSFLPMVLFCVVLVFLDFLHCLILFSYGFPWIFLWLPFFVCVPIVPWLSHNFICFTCGFLCFSLFCCFPIVVLWLCAPTGFLGSPMALLGFAIWFPVVFLGPPYEKLNRNQETLEINGNQCKNKVSQDPRTIRNPPSSPN